MVYVSIGAAAALLLIAFAVLFLRLASRFDAGSCSPQWLDEFSVEDYAPMERLLDRSDFEFLAAQDGYRPEIGKRLLADRRKAFSEYLSRLIRDFNQLHSLAKFILVHAAEDRPEFAQALWRQQIRFYFSVCVVRCKVALYPLGWTAVDVPHLVYALRRLHRQIQESMASAVPGAVPS
ncbi:MAG TPA: hypothetical protein VEV17_13510 [Bryobacteraceae bacterium]|nr:hypothetical protein [Bryobacteraceae bacterium]